MARNKIISAKMLSDVIYPYNIFDLFTVST